MVGSYFARVVKTTYTGVGADFLQNWSLIETRYSGGFLNDPDPYLCANYTKPTIETYALGQYLSSGRN